MSRFLENKEAIAKLRKCFAGLWSLDESNTVKDAIERPGLYVMKPQREGGGLAHEIASMYIVIVIFIKMSDIRSSHLRKQYLWGRCEGSSSETAEGRHWK